MIEPKIKNKINNNLKISVNEILYYVNALAINDEEKDLKKILTAKYILVNFRKIISKMNLNEVSDLIFKVKDTRFGDINFKSIK